MAFLELMVKVGE